MPALVPTGALVSIGQAVLMVVGLNPQRIGTMSEARVVGLPTFVGMDYQITGMGEVHTRFEALTFPHVVGGLDAVSLLQIYHQAQTTVNYIRLLNTATFLAKMAGQVQIRHLYIDETKLHPFDGVGRKVAVELDLVIVGDGLQVDPPIAVSGAS